MSSTASFQVHPSACLAQKVSSPPNWNALSLSSQESALALIAESLNQLFSSENAPAMEEQKEVQVDRQTNTSYHLKRSSQEPLTLDDPPSSWGASWESSREIFV